MFTLVICLVVVALSGAAVLHITLAEPSQPATRRSRNELTEIPAEPPSPPTPPKSPPARAGRALSPPPVLVETHRIRSAGLLVLLLTTLGIVLASVVAVLAVATVVALRGALVG